MHLNSGNAVVAMHGIDKRLLNDEMNPHLIKYYNMVPTPAIFTKKKVDSY